MENGQEIFLWVGKAVASPWVQQVLGVSSFASIDSSVSVLPVLGNPVSARVRQIIADLRDDRKPFMKVRALRYFLCW